MDKVKAITSKFSLSGTPGSKLSKAFKFDKEHNVLTRTADPFIDGPVFEEPSLPRSHMFIHCGSLFFTFLAICTMGGVAGFQAKWVGVSGGTGFTLFVLISSFLLSSFLLIVPIVYDRWDRLKRPAQFLHEPRTTFLLHAFGTGMMLLAAMIVTISAWTAPGCKDPENDPNAEKGDEFKKGLSQFCQTKKASGIFDWMALGCWLALLILAGLRFRTTRKENRRREPSFIPPADNDFPASYSNINTVANANSAPEEHYYAEPKIDNSVAFQQGGRGSAVGTDYSSQVAYDPVPMHQHQQRPVMVTAVSDVGSQYGSAGDRTSRTMQLAYSDPYAVIKSTLMSEQQYSQPATYQTAAYQQQLPVPPQYPQYR